jgi:hypothetical protein
MRPRRSARLPARSPTDRRCCDDGHGEVVQGPSARRYETALTCNWHKVRTFSHRVSLLVSAKCPALARQGQRGIASAGKHSERDLLAISRMRRMWLTQSDIGILKNIAAGGSPTTGGPHLIRLELLGLIRETTAGPTLTRKGVAASSLPTVVPEETSVATRRRDAIGRKRALERQFRPSSAGRLGGDRPSLTLSQATLAELPGIIAGAWRVGRRPGRRPGGDARICSPASP